MRVDWKNMDLKLKKKKKNRNKRPVPELNIALSTIWEEIQYESCFSRSHTYSHV